MRPKDWLWRIILIILRWTEYKIFLRILLYSFHNEHVLFESLQTTLQYLKNCYNLKVYLQPSRTSTMELFLRK